MCFKKTFFHKEHHLLITAMKSVVYVYVFVLLGLLFASRANANSLGRFENASGVSDDIEQQAFAKLGSKVCMKVLGCFEITADFFRALYRPVNFLPQDRATINTKFHLYTKEHPKEDHIIEAEDIAELKNSPLDPTHRTAFIVHGFFDSRYYGKWMQTLREDLLLFTDYNVIIVDWSKGNGAPYTQATANTRVVGAEIALMIEALKKHKGVKLEDCHIIGHSLGAHIAGYAGERLKKLGRISGLDPAQPYFQNMPPSVRLDPTDADFVDVIHTDSVSASILFIALGMSQAVGHVDFYPNNGQNQPGCTTASIHSIFLEGLIDATRRVVACNHQRSVDFYSYSINYKKALPVAYRCPDYQNYLDGKCGECGPNNINCAIMGLKADQFKPHKNDKKEVKMYIATAGLQPFWEYSYQIQIKLRKTKYSDDAGEVYLKLQGPKNTFDLTLKTKKDQLVQGSLYTFLERRKEPFGDIKGLTFGWKSSSWNILKTHAISPEFVKIIPMNSGNETLQKQDTRTFCDKTAKPIVTKTSKALTKC